MSNEDMFLTNIKRDAQFSKPPEQLWAELDNDGVKDYWEADQEMPESARISH